MLPPGTMISSNQGVLITGGQFHQYNNYHSQTSLGNKAPIDILTEAVAPNALHNSGATFDKPKCHPRTRVKIREIIMRWILLGRDGDDQAGKQFMWLNGAAGCGKSAIAQSTIESCIGQRLLLASFFFNRSDATRNHAGSFVATLAYQLYCAFPETEVQTEILSTIKKDPLVFKKTLQEQFTSLIIQPLRAHLSKDRSAQLPVPFLIVIDGLDECTDHTAQKAVLTCLAESLRHSSISIPIFVASRPEHDIKMSFSSKSLKDIHTCLSLDLQGTNDANSDVRLYLYDRFAEIKDDFDTRTTGRKLDQDWPGDKVIESLVWKASGQFIYAATVIRYVESTRHRPDHRLDIVLNLRPVHGDHPFAELDSLYAMILKSALDIERVLDVLSLCFINDGPICCSIIEKLLSYDEGEVETLFCDMGALVQFELDNYLEEFPLYLRFLHASLRDYLLDAARSKEFHINREYKTIEHVTHALRYFASCGSSSFDLSSTAGSPMYLLRAFRYWMGQDHNSQNTISLELRQAILSFPLKEFLEPHSTSSNTYQRLLQFFVTPFLELLEAMVINNPTSSYIQDYQLGILRSCLLLQIQRYFDDDRLALVLVLFYHLGSHHCVPVLQIPQLIYWHPTPFYLVLHFHKVDVLSLSYIWPDLRVTGTGCSLGDRDDIYYRFVRQMLRDSGLTAQALGPVMHERAALACFGELVKAVPLPLSSSENTIVVATVPDDAEDDTYPNLRFNSLNRAQWEYACSSEFGFDDKELYFLSLGYLIFLLPRCGRSDALVAACEEWKTRLVNQSDHPFPVRRRLLCEEIDSYLARGSPVLDV
ncbi:hypothetical protein D9613_006411 [Agrocybe pediades]|uniref:Nephrocystin 3-like N-terminal domain-containing protein n=1 Tax=Agrocybe pediades TaxID=84607 RepID=A0A8H4QUY1_9AGAR|nr:hypothetical protein D9613_006411 [Agrocybe pediades]